MADLRGQINTGYLKADLGVIPRRHKSALGYAITIIITIGETIVNWCGFLFN